MVYNVRILADSLAPCGKRLTTFELTYPRFVHAELMTHRLLSRNSASSRAIPIQKMIRQVWHDPAHPVWWGRNQSGMQAREQLAGWRKRAAIALWLFARFFSIGFAWTLWKVGLHKQIANRLLEPWMFITVLVSATEYDNWFKLRCHPDAQPEIKWVADHMRDLYETNAPRQLQAGEWHLPLVDRDDFISIAPDAEALCEARIPGQWDEFEVLLAQEKLLRKVSVGRCARVSYLTHAGRRDLPEDIKLCDRLSFSGHWSPFEHVACALDARLRVGNFIGWRQYRAEVDPDFLR